MVDRMHNTRRLIPAAAGNGAPRVFAHKCRVLAVPGS
ncbi:MAG: hypothetical protein JWO74_3888 [Solirubrobacterales bacterium]|jgi:hypothetical protein|nr:hypothetical protein [Solirubrobacterales bacterium]